LSKKTPDQRRIQDSKWHSDSQLERSVTGGELQTSTSLRSGRDDKAGGLFLFSLTKCILFSEGFAERRGLISLFSHKVHTFFGRLCGKAGGSSLFSLTKCILFSEGFAERRGAHLSFLSQSAFFFRRALRIGRDDKGRVVACRGICEWAVRSFEGSSVCGGSSADPSLRFQKEKRLARIASPFSSRSRVIARRLFPVCRRPSWLDGLPTISPASRVLR
jgi:hypothetical protein